jgi:3-deoxy-D-manno-octulosonic-acid transferase
VYFAYSVLLMLALGLSAPWWLWQMLRYGKYRAGWGERLGRVPERLRFERGAKCIWIHAVSVGEVLAITPVVAELQSLLPECSILVSTTTDTGQKLAREKFGAQGVFYAPLDLPGAVQAYLKALHPRLLVLAESEFWPNLLYKTHVSGVAVAVVNARVSDRSLPRYLRIRSLLARVMCCVSVFLAQSEEDARRLVAIGAPPERVHMGGNLKFEVKPPKRSDLVEQLSAAVRQGHIGPVIVAGSTLYGEEAMLAEAFHVIRKRYREALLVLAPRHPERFEEAAQTLHWQKLPIQRRSQWKREPLIAGGIFLLDSIGELASVYQIADIAFIGGSLVPRGGHNILEPACFGVPIVVGPYTENFRDIIETFRRADAVRIVAPSAQRDTVSALTNCLLELLENDGERERLGHNARTVMDAQAGATERTVEALVGLLPESWLTGAPTEVATERRR